MFFHGIKFEKRSFSKRMTRAADIIIFLRFSAVHYVNAPIFHIFSLMVYRCKNMY